MKFDFSSKSSGWSHKTNPHARDELASVQPLQTIISGGQTGAERAALDVAIRFGLTHGGWCPKDRLAEDGPLGGQYHLRQTPSEGGLQSAAWNVRDSDGTAVFSLMSNLTDGSRRTVELAKKQLKPWIHICRREYNPLGRLRRFIDENGIKILNIAGPRESEEPELYRWVWSALENTFFWGVSNPIYLGGEGEG